MSTNPNKDEAIRILCLDNGGPGTYGGIIIIREYMARLASNLGVDEFDVYPANYFDLMGGVGFGGIIAILLGRLRMNVERATEALVNIANAVFPFESDGPRNPEINSKDLRKAVEHTIEGCGLPLDTKLNDKDAPCKVVLYAATAANLSHPTAFRTYQSSSSNFNPTIVEAMCATVASPSFFSPVKIGPRSREQSFVGGPVGTNNPTRELLKEAGNVFGKARRVSQILSIGAGLPRVLSLDKSEDVKSVNRLLESLASDCEMVATELSARLSNVDAYLRLNVDRGMESVSMDNWRGLGAIESHTNAYLEKSGITQALEASLRRLQERIGTITLAEINHSSAIRMTAKTVPTLTPFYVARNKEWELMLLHLTGSTTVGQRIFPITGMGGCGKTQMVSYFVKEKGSLFNFVVFVDASSQNSIKSDLQAWARSLGGGHEQDVWEDAIRILAHGSHNSKWLFVFDNADDPRLDLRPFLPKSPYGTVIITSRNRDVGNLANTYHLELGEMAQYESLSTLLKAARRQGPLISGELQSANKLMSELGYLAVALVHAGAYCHQLSSIVRGVLQPYTFTQYLALFSSQRAALMTRDGPSTLDGYQRGVYATLDLSYQMIPSDSQGLFRLISYLHHSDISFTMLEAAAKGHFKDPCNYLPRPEEHQRVVADLHSLLCSDGSWSELKVQKMVQCLRAFSLVSTTIVYDSLFLQVHPLVQAWARDALMGDPPHYRAMARTIVVSCSLHDNINIYRFLLPHIDDILSGHCGRLLHVNDQVAFGAVFKDRGRYSDGENLFSTALNMLRDVSVDQNIDKLRVLLFLADTYRLQGRLDEAEKLGLEVLEQRRRILGTDHPRAIAAAQNLANTYFGQGRWGDAEKLGLEVLEQRRRILGTDHPDTIQSAGSMALTYSRQGRWGEAEELGLEVLEQQRRILGTDHPDTIWTAGNLAGIYNRQRRWDEAEKLGLEVLEQRRRILGTDHPRAIATAQNLANTYSGQGRWGDAEKLGLEVLELRRRILGTDHPDTIAVAGNLANNYNRQGRWDEAEKLGLEVLGQRRRILGTDHPDTISAAGNLGITYVGQKRWKEAEELLSQAVEVPSRVNGPQHPDTKAYIRFLVFSYRKQWKFAKVWEMTKLLQ